MRAAVVASPRLEAFLEMLAAERGAARLTLAAYRNDLIDLSGFLAGRGIALDAAEAAELHDYLGAAGTRRLAPRTQEDAAWRVRCQARREPNQ